MKTCAGGTFNPSLGQLIRGVVARIFPPPFLKVLFRLFEGVPVTLRVDEHVRFLVPRRQFLGEREDVAVGHY